MTQHSAETVATPEKEGNVLFNDALNQHLKKLKQTAELKLIIYKLIQYLKIVMGVKKYIWEEKSVAKLKNIFDIK